MKEVTLYTSRREICVVSLKEDNTNNIIANMAFALKLDEKNNHLLIGNFFAFIF